MKGDTWRVDFSVLLRLTSFKNLFYPGVYLNIIPFKQTFFTLQSDCGQSSVLIRWLSGSLSSATGGCDSVSLITQDTGDSQWWNGNVAYQVFSRLADASWGLAIWKYVLCCFFSLVGSFSMTLDWSSYWTSHMCQMQWFWLRAKYSW